jgi:hypothetical protein
MSTQSWTVLAGLAVAACSGSLVRGWADRQPGVYEVKIPNYYGEYTVWRDGHNDVWRKFDAIADELLMVVKDDTLPIDQRVDALGLAEELGATFVVRRLVDVVDLVDERIFKPSEVHPGRHPVVTVLAGYGEKMAPTVVSHAIREADAERRRLFCEALVKGVGAESADREVLRLSQGRENAPPPRFVEEVRQEISRLAKLEK